MRHAAVYGARQPFGFELCSQLLEKGYYVHAVDHQYWMREADEEKWLFVGRNANLDYYEIQNEDDHAKLPFKVPKNCLIFIPVVDYMMRHVSQVRDQLVRQLAAFLHMKELQGACLFFIYPPAANLDQASFLKNVHGIYRDLRTNEVTAIDYCLAAQMDGSAKHQVESFLCGSVEKLARN